MRVVIPKAKSRPLTMQESLDLERGLLASISGDIVAPVGDPERDEESALIRAQRETARTGEVHVVVLSADV